jgi:ABC-2 type transport system permease protein
MRPRGNLYWSVRRELWENRSVWIAPLAVAGVVIFGFLVNIPGWLKPMRSLETLTGAKQVSTVVVPYGMGASAVLFTSIVVAVFYCLDALYGERRDRSILFWKSMPISDLVTVSSKAAIPMAVLPIVAFTIAFATQLVMLAVSTAVLAGSGMDTALLWSRLPFFEMTVTMLYGYAAHILWYAPIFGWLMLVSAWARRTPFLWAVLPFFAICVLEYIALGTTWFASVLRYRVSGAMVEAFKPHDPNALVIHISQLDPGRFLGSTGLWLGLAFAVACFAAAVRLRRDREPI